MEFWEELLRTRILELCISLAILVGLLIFSSEFRNNMIGKSDGEIKDSSKSSESSRETGGPRPTET
ncbi:MAG: hypothetical protein ACW987_18100 [Candidatus Thorarchaeota archaeon]|jgi:hypothetical protein